MVDPRAIELLRQAYQLLVFAEPPDDAGIKWMEDCDEVLDDIEQYLKDKD